MRIVLRNGGGRDVVTWVVPEDFVDLGKWSKVETGYDDAYLYTITIERETGPAVEA